MILLKIIFISIILINESNYEEPNMAQKDSVLEQKAVEMKIHKHIVELRQQAFRIGVQILNQGDTYAMGDKTVTVDVPGKLPFKKNYTDAGFDLFTPYDVELFHGVVTKVPLNIRMELPSGSWARIETKSGLGSKGMLVYAGVIDQGYRGVPHVIMTNLNANGKPIIVKAGEKIAQMTMNPHNLEFFIEEVASVDTDTARAEGGFGSTGVK